MILDFLTFDIFLTPKILVLFYYMIAIIIPIGLWHMRLYILKKITILKSLDKNIKDIFNSLELKKKVLVIFIFIMIFLCMQLCLRMMFEMIIGYFDMHEYLKKIAN